MADVNRNSVARGKPKLLAHVLTVPRGRGEYLRIKLMESGGHPYLEVRSDHFQGSIGSRSSYTTIRLGELDQVIEALCQLDVDSIVSHCQPIAREAMKSKPRDEEGSGQDLIAHPPWFR